MSIGRCEISGKAAGNRERRAVNRPFNGLVGESVDAQGVGNGGNRPTTHTGDTDSLAEKLATLRSWVEQGLERSGRAGGGACVRQAKSGEVCRTWPAAFPS